jgi:allantoinase
VTGRGGSGAPDLIIRAHRVVTPDGIRPAAVAIRDGVITSVGPYETVLSGTGLSGTGPFGTGPSGTGPSATDLPAAGQSRASKTGSSGTRLSESVVSESGQSESGQSASGQSESGLSGIVAVDLASDEVLLPGLVDSHVHVNEPGRTDWEGFATATRAAAAGGITTIIDMPLNSLPPTVDVAALEAKRAAAAGQCHVDVGFWGGAIPGNEHCRSALHAAGVFGFKAFTIDSGVAEFPPLDTIGLERALRQAAELGALMVIHAEDPAAIAVAPPEGWRDYRGFLASRPPGAEVGAIASILDMAGQAGARVHVLHLSSARSLGLIAAAQRDGTRVTAETCPHYLALCAEEIPPGGTQFKCCPPIRQRANRELLWAGLADGIIDCVVSDHSPCPPPLKRLESGDFAVAWGGISSVQLALPVVWTQARARGHSLTDVARWMAGAPADVAGVVGKGAIAPGYAADLVAFAPDEEFVVRPELLAHRHKLTPYAGRRLFGAVRRTWLRGSPVTGDVPAGRLLARNPDVP